ncbi:predicted protein [Scheffersomyces stipitis CBS 6054]|uniref:PPIase cyclophilin-type domain-containing protein n=1 Tax=Scheffersomyces stipitis (strain ATCC 58785 / CBS 6054 / NBRC 10063 / NRRL Y-11545) TaxID=322104 RepID=A3LTY1_PICST|nr:predicted protein [Scheffersomyces stipitis CBS 6054]ABN66492.2 predicted protein [Scheffersomyces stipitis CBS 6054]
MSLEPPTTAKVIFQTSRGPIEIQLWAKEIPTLSRAFLQRCVNKKFNGQKFTSILKSLVQLEVPQDAQFDMRDEFNSRIRFGRRGSVGVARKNEDSRNNHTVASFFITLVELPSYNDKYTIIGRVEGETFYNVIKIADSELDENNVPVYPAVVKDVEIITPYFDDLIADEAEVSVQDEPSKKKSRKEKKPTIKLSYNEEEVDEEDHEDFKMKSAHELLNDKRLSKKFKANVPSAVEEFQKGSRSDKSQYTPKAPIKRDPTIDSDYDSYVDLSSDEDFEISTLQNHRFICKPLR